MTNFQSSKPFLIPSKKTADGGGGFHKTSQVFFFGFQPKKDRFFARKKNMAANQLWRHLSFQTVCWIVAPLGGSLQLGGWIIPGRTVVSGDRITPPLKRAMEFETLLEGVPKISILRGQTRSPSVVTTYVTSRPGSPSSMVLPNRRMAWGICCLFNVLLILMEAPPWCHILESFAMPPRIMWLEYDDFLRLRSEGFVCFTILYM